MNDNNNKIKNFTDATKEKLKETKDKVMGTIGSVQDGAKKVVQQVQDKIQPKTDFKKIEEMLTKINVKELIEKLKANELIDQSITWRKEIYDKLGLVRKELHSTLEEKVDQLTTTVKELSEKIDSLLKKSKTTKKSSK